MTMMIMTMMVCDDDGDDGKDDEPGKHNVGEADGNLDICNDLSRTCIMSDPVMFQ